MALNSYAVSVQRAAPRAIAAVQARLPLQRVPATFATYLNEVYAAGREGLIQLDGQNIFLYRNVNDAPGEVDVEFGVGVRAPFAPIGKVHVTELPPGEVATATHWGNYSQLGGAHAAVIDWCCTNGRRVAGPRWEIYGHWTEDESRLRTDVFYLLER